jgi:hypothetical protein
VTLGRKSFVARCLTKTRASRSKRAGFENAVEKEAGFQWPFEGDPDFTFLVSFVDPEVVTVTA